MIMMTSRPRQEQGKEYHHFSVHVPLLVPTVHVYRLVTNFPHESAKISLRPTTAEHLDVDGWKLEIEGRNEERRTTQSSNQLIHSVVELFYTVRTTMSSAPSSPLVGVLALQGAFEEHQTCMEAVGCRTVQVRTSFVIFKNLHFSFLSY